MSPIAKAGPPATKAAAGAKAEGAKQAPAKRREPKTKTKGGVKGAAKGFERTLDPGQDYRSAMRDLIAHRWGELWRAVPAAVAGQDIEGVHDVRVASRRLRAAMDAAVDCFPAGWYRPLHRTAKEITGALGAVRDRDVLLEAFGADRERAPLEEQPGLDLLIARIERERVAARAEMERFLAELLTSGAAEEVVRRFGPAAAPPPAAAAGSAEARPEEAR